MTDYVKKQRLPEHHVPGKRLGAHFKKDDRSRGYKVVDLLGAAPAVLRDKTWTRRIGAFDQGQLGSCVGNGCVGLVATMPFHTARGKTADNEALAVKVYSLATALDDYPGTYPPDDTGSSVLDGLKALQQMGLILGYRWAFGIDETLQTLSAYGPVAVGVEWHEGFDHPDAQGLVKLSGKVRGGHCFEIVGLHPKRGRTGLVEAVQSWGSSWGLKGRFFFEVDDLKHLLENGGEVGTAVVK